MYYHPRQRRNTRQHHDMSVLYYSNVTIGLKVVCLTLIWYDGGKTLALFLRKSGNMFDVFATNKNLVDKNGKGTPQSPPPPPGVTFSTQNNKKSVSRSPLN